MHTSVQITHVHFYSHALVYSLWLAHKAQGHACTVGAITLSGCIEPAWFIAQKTTSFPSALWIHFSGKDQFPAHPRDKSRQPSRGRCLLSAPLMFRLKCPSSHFTKQGGESGTCALALLFQIMSTFSTESRFEQWDSGTALD